MGRIVRRYARFSGLTVVHTAALCPNAVHFGSSVHYTKAQDVDAGFVIVTGPASANLELTAFPHPLGRIPKSWDMLWQNDTGVVYVGKTASTAWTATHMSLHFSVATMTVHLLVF